MKPPSTFYTLSELMQINEGQPLLEHPRQETSVSTVEEQDFQHPYALSKSLPALQLWILQDKQTFAVQRALIDSGAGDNFMAFFIAQVLFPI